LSAELIRGFDAALKTGERSLLACRGRVGAAKLARLFPDVGHFFLRQQTCELHIVKGARRYDDAGNRRCALGSGTSKMTMTPGPSAGVLYIEINLPPAASISFLAASYRLVVGLLMMLLSACGVYCAVKQKCMISSLGGLAIEFYLQPFQMDHHRRRVTAPLED
jgi:hypothetical protein